MTSLRRYYVDHILALAAELCQKLDDGALGNLEFTLTLNDFRFRDEKGDYWFLDARTTRWYRFDEGEWRPSSTDAKALEGLASRRLEIARAAEGAEPDSEPFFEAEAPETLTPAKALEAAVHTTRAAYERGRMSSTQAERLLAGQYITDEKGLLWTIGVRSGQWYCFQDSQWRKAEQPPAPDALLRVEAGAQPSDTLLQAYAAMLQFFFSGADRLPERVTEPWNPPSAFPEPLTAPDMRCHSCGARNPAGSLFCNQCAARLGCPSCGAANPPDHRFCSQCGAALRG